MTPITYADLTNLLTSYLGLPRVGKVRDSYSLPSRNDKKLRLIIASDRRSIFDFKLGFEVPNVGKVLNAFNIYNRDLLDQKGIRHDLVACGRKIDEFLEYYPQLQGIPELWMRGVVVEELDMYKVELVVRNYLTGSGWEAYNDQKSGRVVCGNLLPEGLMNGSKLPTPIFTPTTKAEKGHDLPLTIQSVNEQHPELQQRTFELFALLTEDIERAGFILGDGKAEAGRNLENGDVVWGDEIGTPDACRF